jgi:hypothetical protein
VPTSEEFRAVPGLRHAHWRRSSVDFQHGTEGPLFYDIKLTLPSE